MTSHNFLKDHAIPNDRGLKRDLIFISYTFSNLYRLFFGRCIGEGKRDLIGRLSIKTRKFIGNTTMDPTLSLLMANLTAVRDGDLVLDPFAGTGSILVAAAEG